MLKVRIEEDSVKALKSRNEPLLAVVRGILAAIHDKEIEKRGRGTEENLSQEEIVAVLEKEAKKRREAIGLFEKGGRNDLAEKERNELTAIEGYLPPRIGEEEILRILDALLSSGERSFPVLIKKAMSELKGRADGARVAELLKKKLS